MRDVRARLELGDAPIARGISGARYLQPGDVVELEVEGIGRLRNTLAPKANDDRNCRYKPKT